MKNLGLSGWTYLPRSPSSNSVEAGLNPSPARRPGEWGDDDGAGESAEEEDEEEQEEATLGRTRWRLVFMRDIQSLVSETINTPEAHSLRRRHLAVHECPMGDGDEYIIWVCCSASSTENESGKFLSGWSS